MKNIKEKNAIAVLPLNNFGGIKILSIEYGINDKIKFCYSFDGKDSRICTSKIKYNEDGEPFFITNNTPFYIKEFCRV